MVQVSEGHFYDPRSYDADDADAPKSFNLNSFFSHMTL